MGELIVETVVENAGIAMPFADFLPSLAPALLEPERAWLEPQFADLKTGVGILSFHSYLLRTPRHNVLIDTCMGNDKERGGHAAFHRLATPWLQNLAAAGLVPEQIDFVMCTHMHADHIGWNTRLVDGRWVPTFPNARYIFARREYDHRLAVWRADRSATFSAFADSVLPVTESGQALIVDDGYELDGHLTIEAAPGHTPGNVVVNMRSGDARAVFAGDVVHHPIQIAHPDCSAAFCEDPVESARCRQAFVERYTDSGVLILPAHFPAPTAGHIASCGANGRRFVFD